MTSISFHEIQADPDAFLRRIEAGESLVVVCGQQAVAEVKPVSAGPNGQRSFGLCEGKFTVPTDFNDPLPADVLKDFEGA